MGIPFFFRKIVTKYGKTIIKPAKLGSTCEHLFLDFNSIIHQSANACITKQPLKKQLEYYPIIIEEILDNITTILNNVKPTKQLYIAVDGLCPVAKMVQQRKRRFMTIWRKKMIKDKHYPDWDSNIITPGTSFMRFLDQELSKFAEANTRKFGFEIKVSGSCEEGEGEHKIFQIIKKGMENCVVYGLDADLMMLSLIHENSDNISLLRDKPAFSNIAGNCENADFLTLSIQQLKIYIEKDFQLNVKEYVILCMFMGNDFIPPLSFLNIRENGIEFIMKKYKELDLNLLNDKGLINLLTLHSLFNKISRVETQYLEESIRSYFTDTMKQPRIITERDADLFPKWTKTADFQLNPHSYYSRFLYTTDIENAVKNYLEGILWTFSYYSRDKYSKTWFYKYNYSPLVTDLAKICMRVQLNDYQVTNQNEFKLLDNPNIQLLMVLPPESMNIIEDENIKKLIITHLTHLFPTGFYVETFLKRYVWECTPCLPKLTLSEIDLHI